MRESANILVVTLKDSAGIKYPEDFIKLAVRASPNVFPTKVKIFSKFI